MSENVGKRRETDGETEEYERPVLTGVMYEIDTIAANIEEDKKGHEEVKNMVVKFLENVPL